MGYIEPKRIYATDEAGHQTDQTVAIIHDASDESVELVLFGTNPTAEDGMTRSQWMWVRLQNGDLILGVFPQDDAYCSVEDDACHPEGM